MISLVCLAGNEEGRRPVLFYWVERGGQAEGRLGRVRIFAS